MAKPFIHTFEKGINQDLHPSVVKENTSVEIVNMRPVASDTGTTFALETIEGNKLAHIGSGLDATFAGYKIIGSAPLRDELYLFLYHPSSGAGAIYKLTFNDLGQVTNVSEIYNDTYNGTSNPDFGWSNNTKINVVAIQETNDIKKLYWVDGSNTIKYAIVSNNLTDNGEPYVHTTNPYFSIDKLEFLPNFSSSAPELTDIVSGNIQTGVIKYAYQLYIQNGAETAYSPTTGFINVTTSNEFASNSGLYVSGDAETNSGKGFVLKITNTNAGFNRARIVAIHWSSINALPTIRIAGEIEISRAGSEFYFTDTGQSLGEYTVEEFSIIAANIFSAEDIVEKDDRLIAANISYDYFDIGEYDARSYRFNSSGISKVYEADDSYYLIYHSGVTKVHAGTSATEGDWEYFDSSDVYQSSGTDWSLPEDADCINKYNDYDNDGNSTYEYMFDSSYSNLGSTGKNIQLNISTKSIDIDKNNSYDTLYETTTSTYISSFTGYANPYVSARFRGLQSNEVYRVGIQFLDERGRTSYVKWINDFRMPRYGIYDDGAGYLESYNIAIELAGNYVRANVMHFRVQVDELPINAVAFRLMIVPRTTNNRNILAEGCGLPVWNDAGIYRPNDADNNVTTPIFRFISPEILFNRNITLGSNDRLSYITDLSNHKTGTITTTTSVVFKLTGINTVRNWLASSTFTNNFTDIDNMSIISPDRSRPTIMLGAQPYVDWVNATYKYSYGGTSLVVDTANSSWSAFGNKFPFIQYERNLFGSQYGGNTYEARAMNTYAPISDVFTTVASFVDTYGGDIFLTYFDYLSLIWDLNHDISVAPGTSSSSSTVEVIYMPVESSINCDVRLYKSYSKYKNMSPIPTYYELIQEYGGTIEDGGTPAHRFEQEGSLYEYNTVYSQYNDVIAYPAKPFDYNFTPIFDTRVMYSDAKINGENSDSWTKFRANNYIDVKSEHGEINSLYVFKNRLMYFQSNGFGVLSMNDRALVQDNNPGMLALGEGGLLDRYNYISNIVGNLNKRSITNSNNSLYWFDPNEKAIYKFTGSEVPLSKVLGMETWLRENYQNEGNLGDKDTVICAYDNKHNEIYFNTYADSYPSSSNYSSEVLVYNEQIDSFSAIYSFKPYIYVTMPNGNLYSANYNQSNRAYLYKHNDETLTNRFTFYGIKTQPLIKFIVNPSYGYSKVFDNIAFYSENWVAGSTSDYKQDWNTTFDKLRVYNDFQNTDWVVLTKGLNLQRRGDEWTLAIPRNAVNDDISNNPDIFDSSNLDDTQTYKSRIRGNYCVVELTSSSTNDLQKFVIPYVKVYYRGSIR